MSCGEESDDYWSYDDPSVWCKHFPSAGGSNQSPININFLDTVSKSYPLFTFSSKYNSNELFKLILLLLNFRLVRTNKMLLNYLYLQLMNNLLLICNWLLDYFYSIERQLLND